MILDIVQLNAEIEELSKKYNTLNKVASTHSAKRRTIVTEWAARKTDLNKAQRKLLENINDDTIDNVNSAQKQLNDVVLRLEVATNQLKEYTKQEAELYAKIRLRKNTLECIEGWKNETSTKND